jgi:hypothetical protein
VARGRKRKENAEEDAMTKLTVQSTRSALALVGAVVLSCAGNAGQTPKRASSLTLFAGPPFPGAGASGAGQSIAAGVDTVTCGPNPPPAGSFGPAPGSTSHIACLYDQSNSMRATIEWIVESVQNDELVHARLTMNPDFVDNSYGVNAVGWDKTTSAPAAPPPAMGKPANPMGMMKAPGMGHSGHAFKDLVGSDHAEFQLSDGAGKLVLHFKADYVSVDASAPSGYATLGVTGGEGKMLLGNASDVVAVSTSIDRDLNACGYSSYTTDSPSTDVNYTPSHGAENWDYRVVYDVWVRKSAFGSAGFGDAIVNFVHASPSKLASNTVDVTPRDCPPGYCADPDGCPCTGEGCSTPPPQKTCGSDNNRDNSCSETGVLPPPPDAGTDKFRPF